MSLDETLHATFDTLRLAVGETLAREIKAASDQVRAAVELEHRLATERAGQTSTPTSVPSARPVAGPADPDHVRQAAYEEGFDAGRADGWDTGRHHGAIEGRHDAHARAVTRELAASERLIDAIRQIDVASAVPEMLDVLLRCAVREAARAAILIVRGEELQGWKFVGFGARTENPTEFRQAIVGAGVIEEAIRSRAAARTHGVVRVPAPAFAELPLGRRAVGVPLIVRQRVVAVLYADQGASAQPHELDAPSEGVSWPVAVEVMTRHASRCLEAAAMLRPAQATATLEAPQAVGAVTGRPR